jgi:cation:H+ antiporter
MPAAVAVLVFLAGALVSLATSWVLVSRLERVGERLGLSEALLGIVAALAADAPEVTAAVSAMVGHEQRVGAGVVLGSNVFNLAALLGLGAVVAGRISLHRKVVVLGGAVALCVAGVCLAVMAGVFPAVAGLVCALAVVAFYMLVLGVGPRGLGRLRLPRRWIAWLRSAVAEEELELDAAIRPRRGRWQDVAVAVASLVVVVVASAAMERAASALGSRYAVPEIVVGGLVLAVVTSLPNAVAAVYLAARGRGAATLSIALNSNTLNVTVGLLLPAAVIGLGGPSSQVALMAAWYIGLTAVLLAFAYRDRGIRRATGVVVIAAYFVFAGSVLVLADATSPDSWIGVAAGGAMVIVSAVRFGFGRRRRPGDAHAGPAPRGRPGRHVAGQSLRISPGVSGNGRHPISGRSQMSKFSRPRSPANGESLLPGWSVNRLWLLGLAASFMVAATDAVLGQRVVLIGLLIIGPCCVLLTGRWVPTGITGLWAIGLAVGLGLPDRIWGTGTHLAFLGAVAAVALTSTLAAAMIGILKPPAPR